MHVLLCWLGIHDWTIWREEGVLFRECCCCGKGMVKTASGYGGRFKWTECVINNSMLEIIKEK